MEIIWELWWLIPAAIAISTIAMASGVGGAIFYSPLFIIVLGLDSKTAIGTALITELFGFSSGLIAYTRAKLIDYKLAKQVLVFSVPFALFGLYLGRFIPSDVLKGVFATGILFIAYQIFNELYHESEENTTNKTYETNHIDAQGKHYQYTICHPNSGRFFASIGGMFVGMISVGLGELLDYHFVSRCKVPTPVAIGTAVFIVVITVLVASLGHFYDFFFHSSSETINSVIGIVIFTIPGVLIGGQIGPRLQKIIPEKSMKIGLIFLFVLVGVIMFFTFIN